ncbi:MAG TPA: hypothetical protein VLH18_00220 [Candidatus Limnocylindrales bacterium]|nr:hypothetical protein [Candidatus Limnocylindrales bacterium]
MVKRGLLLRQAAYLREAVRAIVPSIIRGGQGVLKNAILVGGYVNVAG